MTKKPEEKDLKDAAAILKKAEEAKKKAEPLIITSNPVKLKDRDGRDSYAIDLTKINFVPDLIVIAKVRGKNNTIRVMAVKNSPNQNGKSDKPDTKKTK
jgi:hypothetical protein